MADDFKKTLSAVSTQGRPGVSRSGKVYSMQRGAKSAPVRIEAINKAAEKPSSDPDTLDWLNRVAARISDPNLAVAYISVEQLNSSLPGATSGPVSTVPSIVIRASIPYGADSTPEKLVLFDSCVGTLLHEIRQAEQDLPSALTDVIVRKGLRQITLRVIHHGDDAGGGHLIIRAVIPESKKKD